MFYCVFVAKSWKGDFNLSFTWLNKGKEHEETQEIRLLEFVNFVLNLQINVRDEIQ